MAIIKNHDFVEIEYTGRVKEDNSVFDTTDEDIAKQSEVFDKHADYKPMVICIGENHILKSVEDQLIGKETGKGYIFDIKAESAFGKKDAKLIQLIPFSKFRQQNIQPFPGLQLNIDGVYGVVKTVSGGRCLVDFNHPLAGKDLVYEIMANRIVEEINEKLRSLLKINLQMKDPEIALNENKAEIRSKTKVPKEAQDELKGIIFRTIPDIKDITFTIAQEGK